MNNIDLVKMGFQNLVRRKLRTFLTVLGIIIGTISIVIMISLGIGLKEGFNNTIKEMGDLNIINIMPNYGGYDEGPGMGESIKNKKTKLKDEDVRTLEGMTGVEVVCPLFRTNAKIVSGKYSSYANLVGIDPEKMEKVGFKVEQGRLLQAGDKLDIVFGGDATRDFYNPKERYHRGGPDDKPKVDVMKDPLVLTFDMMYGEKVPPGVPGETKKKAAEKYKIKGVGILEGKNNQNSYSVFMPLAQVKMIKQKYDKLNSGNNRGGMYREDPSSYNEIMVKVKDIKDVKEIQKKMKDMGYYATSVTDYIDTTQKTQNIIQLVLGGIGGVALLVAAIGIANTMVMSIYERKKEIGVMKVIGASIKDIRRLFLLEATIIGFIGGLLGLGCCFIISKVINKLSGGFMNFLGPGGGNISIIPFWLAILAVVFTSLVGILSGFLPALKATKISALEAIKSE